VLVHGALQKTQPDIEELEKAVEIALDQASRPLSETARIIARRFNISKKEVYELALQKKDKR
jgi:hypothetical protein